MQYVTQTLLSEESERNFREMLERLTDNKYLIFAAMVFAIEHSEYSQKVLEMISLYCPEDFLKLFLISDILYNCNKVDVQYSWTYLPLIESFLPTFVVCLKGSEKAFQVISTWQTWGIFDYKYLLGLRSLLSSHQAKENNLGKIYAKLLGFCDDYYVRNKCKGFGQDVKGDKSAQISRLLDFFNYLMETAEIKDEWIYVEVCSHGEKPEKIIDIVDQKIDLLRSEQMAGVTMSEEDLEIVKKTIGKFPNTYITQHK